MATQVSKLNYVNSKLGAPTSGQQTTRFLYDSVVPTAGATAVEFFKVFQGKTQARTNLQVSKLDSSESVVIKSLAFAFMSRLTDGYNQVVDQPLIASVYVGNEQVVKDLPINFGVTGNAYDRLHANAGASVSGVDAAGNPVSDAYNGFHEIRLLTDIVIPPQTNFYVVVEGDLSTISGGSAPLIVCALGGYGKIFSAGASF